MRPLFKIQLFYDGTTIKKLQEKILPYEECLALEETFKNSMAGKNCHVIIRPL